MPTTLVSTGVQFPDNSVQTVARTTSNTVTSFNGSVGAVSYTAPVTSVNGMTGAVTVSASPTTDQVLSATAGASVGAVGTYAILVREGSNGTISVGATFAGSGLRYVGSHQSRFASAYGNQFLVFSQGGRSFNAGNGGTPGGTWRAMGFAPYASWSENESAVNATSPTLFLRIS